MRRSLPLILTLTLGACTPLASVSTLPGAPTQIPSAEASQAPDTPATIPLTALGVVNTRIASISIEVAPLKIGRFSFDPLEILRVLDASASLPPGSFGAMYARYSPFPSPESNWAKAEGYFTPASLQDGTATHVLFMHETLPSDAFVIRRGGTPLSPDTYALAQNVQIDSFPFPKIVTFWLPDSQYGVTQVGLSEGYAWRYRSGFPMAYQYLWKPTQDPHAIYHNLAYRRQATASIICEVSELDGTLVSGLSRAHFRVSPVVSGLPSDPNAEFDALELSSGSYRIRLPLEHDDTVPVTFAAEVQVVNAPAKSQTVQF